jgi:cysteine desulfurase
MIYLDYAATTPLDKDVLDSMMPYLTDTYGNASSVHTEGRNARLAIERARQLVATFLDCEAKEIVFTASATEANNLAVKGVIDSVRHRFPLSDSLPEIIVSPIEHPCVMESVKHVEALGLAKINWLTVDEYGRVSPDEVLSKITDKTVLVSVMYVNNEIGTIQPIKEISSIIRKVRDTRINSGISLPIYFHSDAVQAVQYLPHSVKELGVDLLSVTSHKLYGPKGAGALYIRAGTQVTRQIDGGGQEYYLRAGTENVAAIVGFGHSVGKIVSDVGAESTRLRELQRFTVQNVLSRVPKSHLSGHPVERAPHIVSFLFEDIDIESLVIALDRKGIATSSGSACSSGVVKQSHVISALNLSFGKTSGPLRLSFGKDTVQVHLEEFVSVLPDIIASLRALEL